MQPEVAVVHGFALAKANAKSFRHFHWVSTWQVFLAEHPRPHPLFDPAVIPAGGLSVWQPDWMHTKLLGTDATLLGSCILYLIKEVMPEGIARKPPSHLGERPCFL